MAHKELVVAWFNEGISWLPMDIPVFLYNKNRHLPVLHHNTKMVMLRNVGRESHSYLTHIVRHYDDLADLTIFVQGDPFPHCANIRDVLGDDDIDNMYMTNSKLYRGTPRANRRFLPLGTAMYTYVPSPDWKAAIRESYGGASLDYLWHWIERSVPTPLPTLFPLRTTKGSQFVVTREAVRTISLTAYQELLTFNSHDEFLPYTIEFLWEMIFEPYPRIFL